MKNNKGNGMLTNINLINLSMYTIKIISNKFYRATGVHWNL